MLLHKDSAAPVAPYEPTSGAGIAHPLLISNTMSIAHFAKPRERMTATYVPPVSLMSNLNMTNTSQTSSIPALANVEMSSNLTSTDHAFTSEIHTVRAGATSAPAHAQRDPARIHSPTPAQHLFAQKVRRRSSLSIRGQQPPVFGGGGVRNQRIASVSTLGNHRTPSVPNLLLTSYGGGIYEDVHTGAHTKASHLRHKHSFDARRLVKSTNPSASDLCQEPSDVRLAHRVRRNSVQAAAPASRWTRGGGAHSPSYCSGDDRSECNRQGSLSMLLQAIFPQHLQQPHVDKRSRGNSRRPSRLISRRVSVSLGDGYLQHAATSSFSQCNSPRAGGADSHMSDCFALSAAQTEHTHCVDNHASCGAISPLRRCSTAGASTLSRIGNPVSGLPGELPMHPARVWLTQQDVMNLEIGRAHV